jgi:hypothetical protein
LIARGATIDDPIGIIFEAYSIVSCYNFTKYIEQQHKDYLNGKLTGLTHEALLSSAKCKFDFLKLKGQWGAKSSNNKKIVAVVAKLSVLRRQLKLDQKLRDMGNSTGEGKGGGKTNNKKIPPTKQSKRRTRHGRRSLLRTVTRRARPSESNYHLCEHHMAWTVHLPADCCLGKKQKEEQKAQPAYKANFETIAAAAASPIDTQFQALLASLSGLQEEE